MINFKSKKFKRTSTTLALVALTIVAVILLNVAITALGNKLYLNIDLSGGYFFTLSDDCKELIKDNFDNRDKKVKIIFCDDEDDVEGYDLSMYVLETARQLRTEFPNNIEIEFVNIYNNPTAVNKYKTTSLEEIASTDVIFVSDTEYRVYSLDAFYATTSDSTSVWAYNGEKKFAAAILAITRMDKPLAGVLLNHGEYFYDDSLLTLLEDAGFKIITLDLSKDEIPDDLRLILCYNPSKDFMGSADVGEGEKSEISALKEYLDDLNNSFMVFMSPSTPYLKNLEEFLEGYGVVFDRHETGDGIASGIVKESSAYSVTSDGYGNVGQYVTTGLGSTITENMRNVVSPAKVIFRNSMAIYCPDTYSLYRGDDDISGTDDDVVQYYKDGVTRNRFEVFTSSYSASEYIGDTKLNIEDKKAPYTYMTITEEPKVYSENVVTIEGDLVDYEKCKASSYVIAFGSVEFATEQYLMSSTYGNADVLLRTFYEMSKEAVPVSLPIKPFEDTEIENLTGNTASVLTTIMAAIPFVVALGVGTVVLVRRKRK